MYNFVVYRELAGNSRDDFKITLDEKIDLIWAENKRTSKFRYHSDRGSCEMTLSSESPEELGPVECGLYEVRTASGGCKECDQFSKPSFDGTECVYDIYCKKNQRFDLDGTCVECPPN